MRSFLTSAVTVWGLVMSISPILQFRLILKRRESAGLSVGWLVILLFGFALWLLYGLAIQNLPLILANLAACIAYGLLLSATLIFRGKAQPVNGAAPRLAAQKRPGWRGRYSRATRS